MAVTVQNNVWSIYCIVQERIGDIAFVMLLYNAYIDASHLFFSIATPTSGLQMHRSLHQESRGERYRFIPSIDSQLTGKLSVPKISNVSHRASGGGPTSCSRYQPQICMLP